MRVERVAEGSPAERAGIREGDDLAGMCGLPVRDSLDVAYAMGWADDGSGEIEAEFLREGESLTFALPAARPEDLGMTLADDEYSTCRNRCVFCFVDQLPDDLRDSLSLKDEDFRLSFAFGNYVTLTNLSGDDLARISEQRLSPLYVSVHATDDDVRRELLGNPGAPPILDELRRLAGERVTIHTQVVIVPGVNDGDVFRRTLDELTAIDAVASVAVVPVGLTSHRRGLPDIAPVTPKLASELLDEIEVRQERLLRDRGSRVIFAVDELYLIAGRRPPPFEHYEDFPQIENGVGLLRAFERDFRERVSMLEGRLQDELTLSIVTGEAAADFLADLVPPALAEAGPIRTHIVTAQNRLLGPTVTVAGLLSGADMARALGEAGGEDLVLLPGEAFNADGVTLDDMTVEEVARAAGRDVVVAARDITDAILDHLQSGPECDGAGRCAVPDTASGSGDEREGEA